MHAGSTVTERFAASGEEAASGHRNTTLREVAAGPVTAVGGDQATTHFQP